MISNFHSAVPARRFAPSVGVGEVVAGNAGVGVRGRDALEMLGRHPPLARAVFPGLLRPADHIERVEACGEDLAAVRHGLFHREPAVLDDGRGSIPGEEGGSGGEGAREPREQEKASEKQEFFHGVSSRVAALHAMIRQRLGDNGRLCFQYRSRRRSAQGVTEGLFT